MPVDHSGLARRLAWQWRFAIEVVVIAAALLAYFGVRGLTEGSEATAFRNADRVLDIERALRIDWEVWLQKRIVDTHALVTLSNWVYIYMHWPFIAVAAVWLFFRRPGTYYLMRNAFLVSGALGLVIFVTFPVAPPRLTDMDVIDTVTKYSRSYRVLQPSGFVNQYAAMPSLHFGWNLLLGIALAWQGPWRVVRAVGWVVPALMALAVVLTANHFVLDVVAGGTLALFGLLVAWCARPWIERRGRLASILS
ncbi:MAG: phosphatase PAP2 family protein [Dehalococcoidia bacterium]